MWFKGKLCFSATMAYLLAVLVFLAMASGSDIQTSCEGEECFVGDSGMSLLHVKKEVDAPSLPAAPDDGEREESMEVESEKEHFLLDVEAAERFMLEKQGVKSVSELNASQQAALQECKAKIAAGTNETLVPIQGGEDRYCPSNQRFDISEITGRSWTLAACQMLSCAGFFYGNQCGPYFYTSADDSTYAPCKCCTRANPTLLKSSLGNNVYSC